VERYEFRGWGPIRDFLLPLKSFTTRFALMAAGAWTIIVNDMYGEISLVDVMGISRASGCRAVGAYFRDESRQWHVVTNGELVRSVLCYLEGEKWVFQQTGEPRPWEDIRTYQKRRIRDRLTCDLVCKYVEKVTGMTCPPKWSTTLVSVGLERSTKDLVVPVRLWEVDVDV
jgi:hypothetical protein